MANALSQIRVLDLTDHRGELAGRLLADLGAEVVKVEPPGGTVSRSMPPFNAQGESLYWACYGAGKQCYSMDLADHEDRRRFLDLVACADVLIESFEPGHAASIGISYPDLVELNHRLVYLAITPYGQSGPKAHWPATDLTIEAAGGRIAIQGDGDRAPLPVGFPQASLHAGAQAAADIVIALNERERSGRGQFLDLSMQDAMWWTLMNYQGSPVCQNEDAPFVGDDRGERPPAQGLRMVRAKDGLITIAPAASRAGTRSMFTFAVEEAREYGEVPEGLDAYDWDNWLALYQAQTIDQNHLRQVNALLDSYVARRTKLELVDWALSNNLRLGPIHNTKDLLGFPQYVERGFFQDIGGLKQPANWVRMSRTPLSFGAATRTQSGMPSWSVRSHPPIADSRSGLAFDGLKVADFSWVAAGPTIAKALADHGATVVKVESATRPDLSRTLAPFIDGESGLNRSYWGYLYATSKLSLQCNLSIPDARGLARQVCDWADVVIESFSPGTMARLGLDYETLSEDHPELIMFSTSMLGQTGPYSTYAGFGQQASGFAGLHYITGWPDREPCGVATPYTDVIAPKFGVTSLAAALLERERSGKGQLIDLAQAECSMFFLAPLLLDQAANHRTAERSGYDSDYACPQGVYPCAGTERYIAIAVESPEQWQSLLQFVPLAEYDQPGYDHLTNRIGQREPINQLISAWTATRDAFDLESQLTATGIPAAVVQRPMDVYNDPQIESRGIKRILPHTECGDVVHYGFCTHYSARQQMVRSAPPCIGEHNDYVMRELLSMSDAEIAQLKSSGAIE